MRLIFTDIDGVFNTTSSRRATRKAGIVPDCVTRFDQMCIDTDATVVVTSAWRKYTSLTDICSILGTTIRSRFTGMTPNVVGNKSKQIFDWLDWHNLLNARWIAIDDNATFFSHDDRGNLVTTDKRVGLTDADVARATALLHGKAHML